MCWRGLDLARGDSLALSKTFPANHNVDNGGNVQGGGSTGMRGTASASSISYSEVGGTMAVVSFSDLQLAFEFVSSGGMGENEAYLDRQSGKIYWHSEFGDNDEELPDDIDDEKYISIPDKRELDLGMPLVLDFAREFLPDDYDEVRHIFSRRGAYRRYKELLVQRGALERWYDFSNKAEEAALRKWCAENGIELSSI